MNSSGVQHYNVQFTLRTYEMMSLCMTFRGYPGTLHICMTLKFGFMNEKSNITFNIHCHTWQMNIPNELRFYFF